MTYNVFGETLNLAQSINLVTPMVNRATANGGSVCLSVCHTRECHA